jgi:hypothetical protein
MWRNSLFGGALAIVAATYPVGALADMRTFANTYVSFQLPDSWECALQTSDWVCNEREGAPFAAIMIITAKEAGSEDTLDQYYDYLAQPKTVINGDKRTLRSKIISVRRSTIGGQEWIDSEHFESELPNYYTHYLATVKGKVAIVVTLSAVRTVYQGMASQFAAAVNSLQVTDPLFSGRR